MDFISFDFFFICDPNKNRCSIFLKKKSVLVLSILNYFVNKILNFKVFILYLKI